MSFIDERLLELVAYGFQGGPTFSTTRVQLLSGVTRRNAERSRPLYQYQAPYDRIHSDHHKLVIAAFNTCLGPMGSFRFKDWADYQLTDEIAGTADGTIDQELQIVKNYGFGSETMARPITKPVDSTKYTIANGYVTDAAALVVKADGVPISFAVDYATGILTFTATDTEVITVSGEFDVPVYFNDDGLPFSFDNWEAHSVDVKLVEDFAA